MATLPIPDPAFDLVGSIRTFGEYGPMYEVTGVAAASSTGEAMVSILVIESGERLDYEAEAVMLDPEKP